VVLRVGRAVILGYSLQLSSAVASVVTVWYCASRRLISSCRPRSVLAVLSSCGVPRSLCYESTGGVDSMALLSKLAWPFVVPSLVLWVLVLSSRVRGYSCRDPASLLRTLNSYSEFGYRFYCASCFFFFLGVVVV
jgi:hypothetical protein